MVDIGQDKVHKLTNFHITNQEIHTWTNSKRSWENGQEDMMEDTAIRWKITLKNIILVGARSHGPWPKSIPKQTPWCSLFTSQLILSYINPI